MSAKQLLDLAIVDVDTARDMCHAAISERWSFAERMQGSHEDTDLGRLQKQLDTAINRLNEARARL